MSRVMVIAEAGVNHNGSVTTAKIMCDSAKLAGCDVVKFQTYIPEKSIRRDSPDFATLAALALSFADTKNVAMHCESIGIEFCSTPDDLDSLKFLVEECGVKRIKIGSGSLRYRPLIYAAMQMGRGLPIIMSTGMATIKEIAQSITMIFPAPLYDITLMHCVSLYPCPTEAANLRAIATLQRFTLPVGYSDHTMSVDAVPAAAVALGAVAIEKHFTMSRAQAGPDHHISLEPSELRRMVDVIREAEKALGDGRKEPSAAELAMIPRMRKDSDGRQAGI